MGSFGYRLSRLKRARAVKRFDKTGTGFDAASSPAPVHVDAAAKAAELAVTRDVTGIYNIAEEDGAVSSAKVRRLLGWNAGWRVGQ